VMPVESVSFGRQAAATEPSSALCKLQIQLSWTCEAFWDRDQALAVWRMVSMLFLLPFLPDPAGAGDVT